MEVQIVNLPTDMEWTTKIGVEGRLDATTSPKFEKAMEPILNQAMDFLILDLSRVPFISSAGLRALMYINQTLAKQNSKVICINMQPQIAKVMETIKQLPGLHVFKNDEEMDKYLIEIQEEVLRKKQKP
jgi:anti-sigma B factor antagonist